MGVGKKISTHGSMATTQCHIGMFPLIAAVLDGDYGYYNPKSLLRTVRIRENIPRITARPDIGDRPTCGGETLSRGTRARIRLGFRVPRCSFQELADADKARGKEWSSERRFGLILAVSLSRSGTSQAKQKGHLESRRCFASRQSWPTMWRMPCWAQSLQC